LEPVGDNKLRLFRKQSKPGDIRAQRFDPLIADDSPRVVIAHDPDPEELMFLQDAVLNYNLQRAGPHAYRKLAAFLRESGGHVLGGIMGGTYWGWLQVDFLWVPSELRGQGYGRQLLAAAENQARERGCHHACLDTFTFQAAAGFYQKSGYIRLGSLPDFPSGNERIFLYKALLA
jgi:GNAT superfamily N-acetyltransferase